MELKDRLRKEFKDMQDTVNEHLLVKNVVSTREFEKFRPLYEPPVPHPNDPLFYERLSEEFSFRFNKFAEIVITDNGRPDGRIIQKLPAVFVSPKTFGEAGARSTLDHLTTVMKREDSPMSIDREIVTREMKHAIPKLVDEESVKNQSLSKALNESVEDDDGEDLDVLWE
jgi:hypothetical protein